ncbi:hypothetical protein QMZ92_13270 [Streptomyces sp. HNM0645]|uniref:hypothetical protein n=1 Tax=Streptomyces sp. HNM0645 TaxID=2782343 RepID=UPI0024B83FB1|nr:hypothetical protein [Streptomyces sp. HNM0645]MDI9885338.1 hypothetical protein [Streptomyces sp. HNM0645]
MNDLTLRAVGLIYPGLLLLAVAILAVILLRDDRRQRRQAALIAYLRADRDRLRDELDRAYRRHDAADALRYAFPALDPQEQRRA